MKFDVLTLFPEMFAGPLGSSILKRGMQAGHFGVRLHNIRDYAHDRHHTVDDYPYGGGAGMVMKAEPLAAAIEYVLALPEPPTGLYVHHPGLADEVLVEGPGPNEAPSSPSPQRGEGWGEGKAASDEAQVPIILMSPAGRVFNQIIAAELAQHQRLVLVCGHYEGIDERVREHLISDEISVGDYVLTGGELAAMVVVDAVARLVPGVLADESAADESHTSGLLEYPQYTRPAEFRGWQIPEILTSGHHANVAAWRRREALRRTLLRRPEMLARIDLSARERKWLQELKAEIGQEEDRADER